MVEQEAKSSSPRTLITAPAVWEPQSESRTG